MKKICVSKWVGLDNKNSLKRLALVTLSQRNSSNNKDTEDKHNPIYWNLYRVYK